MSNEFDIRGLDDYTNRMFKRLTIEYPKEAEKLMKQTVGNCKAEAISRTKRGPTGNLKKRWKHKVKSKPGKTLGIIQNTAPHAHLVENGHVTKNGGWVEGQHMLENTITNQQPKIDRAIEEFVDRMLDF